MGGGGAAMRMNVTARLAPHAPMKHALVGGQLRVLQLREDRG